MNRGTNRSGRIPDEVENTIRDVTGNWELIADLKSAFIRTGELPGDVRIPKEIRQSWNVSRSDGVPWQEPMPLSRLDENGLEEARRRNSLLISIASPFMNAYQHIEAVFSLALCDTDGVILSLYTGKYNENRKMPDLSPGAVWGNQCGTSAHMLAMAHNRPVHIMGALNYSQALDGYVTSAVPLCGGADHLSGHVLGGMLLVHPRGSDAVESGFNWILSTASAISGQLNLAQNNYSLRMAHASGKTASAPEEGYLSIDSTGLVIVMSNAAEKMLENPYDNIGDHEAGLSIYAILQDPVAIRYAINKGRAIRDIELSLLSNRNNTFSADIEPFAGKYKNKISGAVIRLKTSPVKGFPVKEQDVSFDSLIYGKGVMEKLINSAKIVSQTPLNIVLSGESGTEKESLARAIHNSGTIAPFKMINCEGASEYVIRKEFFGDGYHKGLIKGAYGGTLFIDGAEGIPPKFYTEFLSKLEKAGASAPRVILGVSARQSDGKTVDIRRLIQELAPVTLELPPLRDRGQDILLMADHVIMDLCKKFDLQSFVLVPQAKEILLNYNWPGNITQLRSAMAYAVTFCPCCEIYPRDLPKEITSFRHSKAMKELSSSIIQQAVRETGSAQAAARYLGLSRATLYRRLKKRP